MSVGFDVFPMIIEILTQGGYIDGMPLPRRRDGQQKLVKVKRGHAVIVHGLFKPQLKDFGVTGSTTQDIFDHYLIELASDIETIVKEGSMNHPKLVLQSGGDLVLPPWFIDKMRQLGVEIVFVGGMIELFSREIIDLLKIENESLNKLHREIIG